MQSVPKLRGFNSLATKPAEVYLSDLETHFADGDTVTLQALKEKNIIGNTVKSAKIVSTGALKKKLAISGLASTRSAAEKIKTAGGSLT